MPKIAKQLTAIEVSRLKAPGKVFVGGVPGLLLQVTDSGARSWILRVTVGNRRRDVGLGAYPAVTLAQAHEKARQARESINQGNDPVVTRERAQSALRAEQVAATTFEDAAIAYIKKESPAWKGKKSHTQWTGSLTEYVYPIIGKLHVQDIQDAHIMKILEQIWVSKTETAVRVRGRIENILDWAAAMKYRTGLNPARWRGHLDKLLPAPKKTTAVVHYEAIPLDDAASFFASLRTREGVATKALAFTALTAARSAETRGATWSEVDTDKALWTIPAARMKAGREHRVPLTDAALAVLRDVPRLDGNDLVFRAPRGGQLSDMALTAVMRRMSLTAVPHGLRSTFSDWAAEKTNFPRDLVEMALAHVVKNKVERAYRHGDMLEKRGALMIAWSKFLETPVISAGNVTTLTRHAA